MLLSAYTVPHPPIILSEIGKGEEEKIAKTQVAYHKIAKEIAHLQPDTILFFSSHAPAYYDYISISSGKEAYGDFANFHASDVKFYEVYDTELALQIQEEAQKANLPAGLLGDHSAQLDHGTMVPLYFIEQELEDFQIVRIAVSDLDREIQYQFGQCIAHVLRESKKRVIVIASGDLSHKLKSDGPYGFSKEGPIFDQKILSIFKSNDFDALLRMDETIVEESAQCGFPTFLMLAGVLSRFSHQTNVLSYEGVFGVGYLIASISIEQDLYVALAKMALEYYIKYHSVLPASCIPKELYQPAAVFVSLKKHGELRGCIGTILPTKDSAGEEIIANAIAAGTRDPRFHCITYEELPLLEYSVDVLSEPEDIDSLNELDVKRYGIIVGDDHHRGLLLPDLVGVDTVEDQVRIALTKAGMDGNDPFYLQRFEVVRHYEM
ncbi:AmmeMemoRadiSam system protein A [[Eubacterium] hominis]|uniref:AmmeMemoRadiSam system protein A n=1 Tax=[Eubacterium] hominis TaxID=2764325 RepID=UPI003A4E41BC